MFTDDAVMRSGAGCGAMNPCVGADAIRKQVELEVRIQLRFRVADVRVSGQEATARLEEKGNPVSDAGVERILLDGILTFRDGRIARIERPFAFSDPQTAAFLYHQTFAAFDGAPPGPTAGRLMTVYTDDAVLEGFGLCQATACIGTAAIQREIERRVADHYREAVIQGSGFEASNTYSIRLEIRADSIRAAGAERIIASTTMTVADRISSIRFALDTTDPQTNVYLATAGP